MSKFKPFQKVLVRDKDDECWRAQHFSYYKCDSSNSYPYVVGGLCGFKQCIPYKGNEHLCDTKNKPGKPKLKVIRGCTSRSEEIINVLRKLGGKKLGYITTYPNWYYFINHDGIIDGFEDNDKFFDCYELETLELPKPKLKVIRGVKDRGDEVLKMLEKMGGTDKHILTGDNDSCYYYIGDDGYISFNEDYTFNESDIEILELPNPKPKLKVIRGNRKRGDEVIKMLKGLGGIKDEILEGTYEGWYYFVNESGIIDSRNISSKYFDSYELEILELPEEQKRWRVNWSQQFFYIGADGSIYAGLERNSEFYNKIYEFGNYFRTKEEAEVMAEKIKTLLKDNI